MRPAAQAQSAGAALTEVVVIGVLGAIALAVSSVLYDKYVMAPPSPRERAR